MVTENKVLMQMARESLRGKWGLAIGAVLLVVVISGLLQVIPIFGGIISLIITGPLTLGLAFFTLSISRNQEAKIEQVFQGFNHFGSAVGAYLLMVVFVLLWMLLLIIPGIIAAISYSMTFFIMADDLSLSPMEAIDKSKQMMEGYKWKYFCLSLRFLGWALLCILTLGIGFLWLMPYVQVSLAKFYDDIKGNNITNEEFSQRVVI